MSGTVKVVDGNSIYVNQPDGTTKRVEANESTRYTRTEPATLRDVQPGRPAHGRGLGRSPTAA